MATYAIGDIQGCFDELMELLALLHFSPTTDTLWFTGDLVNRGPSSLETLRFIKDLGDSAITVLGNHDLHLLACYWLQAGIKPQDTLADILSAPDVDTLCHWLASKPLLHYDTKHKAILVHAGIYPEWSLEETLQYAKEYQVFFENTDKVSFFKQMYGNTPATWSPTLSGFDRIRFFMNVFTRMRFLTENKTLNLSYKGSVEKAPEGLIPWFQQLSGQNQQTKLLFGHWAALDCQTFNQKNIYPLDKGCVWGRGLLALRLEDEKFFHFLPKSYR
jgi:bis(5'-nucleosyl)-tetraphosphatase (symmetrical)